MIGSRALRVLVAASIMALAGCTSTGQSPPATTPQATPSPAASVPQATSAPATPSAVPSSPSASPTAGPPTTVRIILEPYLDCTPWALAKELGFDKQQNLDFQFVNLPNDAQVAAELARGDQDVGWSSISQDIAMLKAVPDLKDWMIIDQFKGFQIIGRTGKTQTYAELSKGVAQDPAARDQILNGFKGKTFVMLGVFFQNLLQGGLEQVGLTLKDVTILNFSDEAKAGAAFIAGNGDYYLGGLPTTTKMLGEPDKFVSVGAQYLLGPGGLWYPSYDSRAPWLDANPETALRVLAVWYRATQFMKEKPDLAWPILTKWGNQLTLNNFSEQQIAYLLTVLIKFHTLDEAGKEIYDPASPLYWKIAADYQVKTQADLLPSGFDFNATFVAPQWYEKLLQRTDLVDWIKSPFD